MSELFNAGQRPAVDSGLSVSRVGSAAQIKAMKQVAGSLKIDLAQYRELQAFSQFGSDLDEDTKNVLNHGAVLMEVLKQPQYAPFDTYRQIVELFAAKNRHLEKVEISNIRNVLDNLYAYIETNHSDLLDELKSKNQFSKELENSLNAAIKEYMEKMI